MIEEKGIYSIEKFLVARRLMYWQVYLHKAVMGAEMLLVKIIHRAKDLIKKNIPAIAATDALNFFLNNSGNHQFIKQHLDKFCNLDDYDVMCTIKNWSTHPDKILSVLCRSLVDRELLKIKLQTEPFNEKTIQEKRCEVAKCLQVTEKEAEYFVFTGEAINTTYDTSEERINILFKDGSIKDISQIDNALIHHQLSGPVKKYYICYYRC
jgi:HD superfamily phosphohydrolase